MRPSVRYAILCNGAFPENPNVRDRLLSCDVVVCCDGAAHSFMRFRKPEFVIGDMDSLPESIREEVSDVVFQDDNQENNDLSKAFGWICSMLGIGKGHALPEFSITIFGATGKREDHAIGNISLLADFGMYLESKGIVDSVSMVTDYGTFFPLTDSRDFALPAGKALSIFAFDESLRIVSDGLDYPTDNVRFDMWWKASLNRVTSGAVRMDFNHPAKVLLYVPDFFESL